MASRVELVPHPPHLSELRRRHQQNLERQLDGLLCEALRTFSMVAAASL